MIRDFKKYLSKWNFQYWLRRSFQKNTFEERIKSLIFSQHEFISSSDAELIFGTIFQDDPSSDSSPIAEPVLNPFPLHLACRQRNYDKVKELVDGAISTYVYATDEIGMTPLQHLISSSLDLKSEEMDTTIKIMDLLRTIKRSKYEDINKDCPLVKAVAAKSFRIVEALLKFDDLDINAGDPLKIAVSNNSLDLAKLISVQPTVIITSACMKELYLSLLL